MGRTKIEWNERSETKRDWRRVAPWRHKRLREEEVTEWKDGQSPLKTVMSEG